MREREREREIGRRGAPGLRREQQPGVPERPQELQVPARAARKQEPAAEPGQADRAPRQVRLHEEAGPLRQPRRRGARLPTASDLPRAAGGDLGQARRERGRAGPRRPSRAEPRQGVLGQGREAEAQERLALGHGEDLLPGGEADPGSLDARGGQHRRGDLHDGTRPVASAARGAEHQGEPRQVAVHEEGGRRDEEKHLEDHVLVEDPAGRRKREDPAPWRAGHPGVAGQLDREAADDRHGVSPRPRAAQEASEGPRGLLHAADAAPSVRRGTNGTKETSMTGHDLAPTLLGKGQMGSALMGSLRCLCFLTEGPFGYSR